MYTEQLRSQLTSCHCFQHVLRHVRMEGLSIVQPVHVTVKMAMLGMTVQCVFCCVECKNTHGYKNVNTYMEYIL